MSMKSIVGAAKPVDLAAPCVLLVFPFHAGPYEGTAAVGILDYLRARGPWKCRFVGAGGFNPAFLTRDFPGLQGAVVGTVDGTDLGKWLPEIKRVGVPMVRVTDLVEQWAEPVVMPDNVAIGENVARHFIERGFTRLAFCGVRGSFSRLREEGFFAVAAEHRAEGHRFETPGPAVNWNDFADVVHPQLRRWLSDLPKPIGIMACADWFAYHLFVCCEQAGLKVPEQVALVGVDNVMPVCEMFAPPLSSIGLNGRRAGYLAAEMLSALMQNQVLPKQVVLAPADHVIVRGSSDVTAVEDEDVATALRYIAENFTRPITRDDIEAALCLGRRTLQLKFQRALGRTIQDEIARLRVNRAKDLLEHTNLPVKDIAEKAGFEGASYFSRAFRRHTQTTPAEFRAQGRMPDFSA